MGFGLPSIRELAINEAEKVVADFEKIDLNHDGIPDAKEASTLITTGVTDLEALEAKITPEEAAAALNILFPGKFTAEEVAIGEASFAKILAGTAKLLALASAAKAELLGKKS